MFEVYGDGVLLWASEPIAVTKQLMPLLVSVLGVDVLELRVRATGSAVASHAVWLEPALTVLHPALCTV